MQGCTMVQVSLGSIIMAQFCPQCGVATIRRRDGGRERNACPACGWVEYSLTAIGVGALVLRGECVLLVERGIPPVGRWTLPSGWVEQDENLAMAVVRELAEETGLAGVPVGLLCLRNITKPVRNEFYACFLCEVDATAEPVPDGDESTQARFVHPDEFDVLDLSPFTRYVYERYVAQPPALWPMTIDEFPYIDVYPGFSLFAGF